MPALSRAPAATCSFLKGASCRAIMEVWAAARWPHARDTGIEMGNTLLHEAGPEISQLREALAASELQLKEARAELGRLVRITERNLAERTAQAQAAIERNEKLEERADAYQRSIYALIDLMVESDLLPGEVIMAWLIQSAVFDPDYYLLANEDVANAGLDPAEHFMEYGITERRAFSDAFPERL